MIRLFDLLTLASSSYHFSWHLASKSNGNSYTFINEHIATKKMNLLFAQFRKFKKMNIHNEK